VAIVVVLLAGTSVVLIKPWNMWSSGFGDPGPAKPDRSREAAAPLTCATGTLRSAGAASIRPAIDQWMNGYAKACPGGEVRYQAMGTGAGAQAFGDRQADLAMIDAPLTGVVQAAVDRRCAGGLLTLPVAILPVAVVYHVPGVADLSLSPQTLAGIFAGRITVWNAPEIRAENRSALLPALSITVVHRSDEAPTTETFTQYLTAAAGSAWSYGSGKAWPAPGGVGARGTDGVAAHVTSVAGAIGYLDGSAVDSADVARIRNQAGVAVPLTPQTASAMVASARRSGTGGDLSVHVDFATTAADTYPIVRVISAIVCERSGALAASFLSYVTHVDGQAQATTLHYAPLPETLRAKVATALH
jgi:phosphate transport system substrate-binding protein